MYQLTYEYIAKIDVALIDYESTMTVEEAQEFIWKHLQRFPFDGRPGDPSAPSAGAAVAVMIGALCHDAFDYWPIVTISTNRPGIGESVLQQALFSPFFGTLEPARPRVRPAVSIGKAVRSGKKVLLFTDADVNNLDTKTLATQQGFFYRSLMTGKHDLQFVFSGTRLRLADYTVYRAIQINLAASKQHGLDFEGLQALLQDEPWRARMREAIYTIARAFITSGEVDSDNWKLKNYACTYSDFNNYFMFCARAAMFAGFGDATASHPLPVDVAETEEKNDRVIAVKKVLDAIASHLAQDKPGKIEVAPYLDAAIVRPIGSREVEARVPVACIKHILAENDLLGVFGGVTQSVNIRVGRALEHLHGSVSGKYSPSLYKTDTGLSYHVGRLLTNNSRCILIRTSAPSVNTQA